MALPSLQRIYPNERWEQSSSSRVATVLACEAPIMTSSGHNYMPNVCDMNHLAPRWA